MLDTAQMTRYERVKQLLDRGAAGSSVDYDGLCAFWQLPLSQFLQVEIRGIRMIAPAETPAPSCCHGGDANAVAESRSSRSGLIRGLRGQAPFDGSQFPPLLWGGRSIPEEDIGFISDWIDDACPASDHQSTFDVAGTTTPTTIEKIDPSNFEEVTRTFPVSDASPNEYTYKYGELKQRPNLDCMSAPQLEKLRWAFRELYSLNKWPEDRRSYNNSALIHQNHCQHGWERFLPWHRIYLYEFEQVLQDVCPGVTMPYWDWTMPQYLPDCPEKGWKIPEYFKAFLTEASIEFLKNATPPLDPKDAAKISKAMLGKLYTSQTDFFADVKATIGDDFIKGPHRDRFIDALLASNSLWYPLRYPAEY